MQEQQPHQDHAAGDAGHQQQVAGQLRRRRAQDECIEVGEEGDHAERAAAGSEAPQPDRQAGERDEERDLDAPPLIQECGGSRCGDHRDQCGGAGGEAPARRVVVDGHRQLDGQQDRGGEEAAVCELVPDDEPGSTGAHQDRGGHRERVGEARVSWVGCGEAPAPLSRRVLHGSKSGRVGAS
ncbi:hypothetical protein [Gordonia iterans]